MTRLELYTRKRFRRYLAVYDRDELAARRAAGETKVEIEAYWAALFPMARKIELRWPKKGNKVRLIATFPFVLPIRGAA